MQRLVFAVPQWPENVERAGNDQQPHERRKERSDEGARVPERAVLIAVKPYRGVRPQLADRLAALGVADGVGDGRACELDEVREGAEDPRERSAARRERREPLNVVGAF